MKLNPYSVFGHTDTHEFITNLEVTDLKWFSIKIGKKGFMRVSPSSTKELTYFAISITTYYCEFYDSRLSLEM